MASSIIKSPDVLSTGTVSNAYCEIEYSCIRAGRIAVLVAKLYTKTSISSSSGYLTAPAYPLVPCYAPACKCDPSAAETATRFLQVSSSGMRFVGSYDADIYYSASIVYIVS